MGVWSKLFGERTATASSGLETTPSFTAPSPGAPSLVTVIPGRLTVTFFAHDTVEDTLGNFLTAVTQGFAKYRQGELVFTLRLTSGDSATSLMPELTRYFATVYGWARQGRLVSAGDLTEFGDRAPFGRSHSGILYADARSIAGVPVPARALVALLVDAEEIRTALAYGAYRVLTRIGERYRHFPFPVWNDLDRKSVVSERDAESSLAKVPCMRAAGVSFVKEDEHLRVLLSRGVKSVLGRGIASLPRGAPFALLVKPQLGANAWLLWHPGQTEAAGISPHGSDGSRTSGSCLVIVPTAKEDSARLFEDGYRLSFSPESFALLASALLDERALSLPMAQGLTLSLEWQPDEPARAADWLA